jgi:hypothetical protein
MAQPTDLGAIAVYRGDAWLLPIVDDDGGSPPVPTNLTAYGSSWTCQARSSEDTDPPVTITVDASNAATGRLNLSMTGTITAGMSGEYKFDVQVTGGTLSPLTMFRGRLRVTKDVTHA